jgi:glycosyltransferase involved in cell wall biosynthesis
VVAGGTCYASGNAEFANFCEDNDAHFIGMISGQLKAEIFANARALLFPTQMNEAFGLPVAEALMSGTPVIASTNGAMTELLDPLGGFVCNDEADYLNAVANLRKIKPADCRRLALETFSLPRHGAQLCNGIRKRNCRSGSYAPAGAIVGVTAPQYYPCISHIPLFVLRRDNIHNQ